MAKAKAEAQAKAKAKAKARAKDKAEASNVRNAWDMRVYTYACTQVYIDVHFLYLELTQEYTKSEQEVPQVTLEAQTSEHHGGIVAESLPELHEDQAQVSTLSEKPKAMPSINRILFLSCHTHTVYTHANT